MILSSGLEHKKVQTALSKHLGIVPKIRGGSNSAKVWIKRASSAVIIFCLGYGVMLCGVPVKWLVSVCPVGLSAWLSDCEQLHLKFI